MNNDTDTQRNTAVVTIATLFSRLLGFVRVGIIASFFGTTAQADVLNLVLQLPNNLRKLLAEGALSTAFIPVISKSIHTNGGSSGIDAQRLVSSLFGAQLLFFIPLLTIATLFSDEIVSFLFAFADVEQHMLAHTIFQQVIWYILPISIGAIMMATINSHGRFIASSMTSIVASLVVIAFVVLFQQTIGIFAVSIGVLLGGAMHVLVQIPSFRLLRYNPLPSFVFKGSGVVDIIKNWMPLLLTSSLVTINQQIAVFFASGLEEGSGSSMIYALTFWQFPYGILTTTVLVVLYPRLCGHFANRNYEDMHRSFRFGVRYILLTCIPASLVMIFYSNPIITIGIGRGLIAEQSITLIAKTLVAYSFGLAGVSLYQLAQRFYFACNNMKTPVVSLCLVITIDVVLSLILKEVYGVVGLAIANTIAFTAGALVLIVLARARFKKLLAVDKPLLFDHLFKAFLVLTLSCAMLYFSTTLYGFLWDYFPHTVVRLLWLIGVVGVFGALVTIGYRLFKIDINPWSIFSSVVRKKST